jgi:predicted nucleic acid-binding protein
VPPRRSPRTAQTAEARLLYADSSALVKLVIDEPESRALERHLADGPALATSRIAVVEVTRATALANPAPEVRAASEHLLDSCLLVDVGPALLRDAAGLASRAIRTLDALHLASALRVEADQLVAYDQRLLSAARACGIAVVSPGQARI